MARRARVLVVSAGRGVVSWWGWAVVGTGLVLAVACQAQPAAVPSPVPGVEGSAPGVAPRTQVPEAVRPPGSATIPPGNDGVLTPPRSENPQVEGSGKPLPDAGGSVSPSVIAPPSTGPMPVIKPPSSGTMPVIPPPGSTGGSKDVVPK